MKKAILSSLMILSMLSATPASAGFCSWVFGPMFFWFKSSTTLPGGMVLTSAKVREQGKVATQTSLTSQQRIKELMGTLKKSEWPARIKAALRTNQDSEKQAVRAAFIRSLEFQNFISKIEAENMLLNQALTQIKADNEQIISWIQQISNKQNHDMFDDQMMRVLDEQSLRLADRREKIEDAIKLTNKLNDGQALVMRFDEVPARVSIRNTTTYQSSDDFLYWYYIYPNIFHQQQWDIANRYAVDRRWEEGRGADAVHFVERGRTVDFLNDKDHDGIPDNRDKFVDTDRDGLDDRRNDPFVDADHDGIRDSEDRMVDADHDGVNDAQDSNVDTDTGSYDSGDSGSSDSGGGE
jgi:hypothetical protein